MKLRVVQSHQQWYARVGYDKLTCATTTSDHSQLKSVPDAGFPHILRLLMNPLSGVSPTLLEAAVTALRTLVSTCGTTVTCCWDALPSDAVPSF